MSIHNQSPKCCNLYYNPIDDEIYLPINISNHNRSTVLQNSSDVMKEEMHGLSMHTSLDPSTHDDGITLYNEMVSPQDLLSIEDSYSGPMKLYH